MTEDKRLFLLDSYALIYRAYYAYQKQLTLNSNGQNTSAVMGFTQSLLDILRKERPSHIAAVFDCAKPTFRHEIFEGYKAQRQETPEVIKESIPIIKDILEAFQIPQIAIEGYEADDVIGTLAKQAEAEGFKVFMITPDKDYAQLVSDGIKMMRPARMGNAIEIWGVDEVLKRFEIKDVSQVKDFLGMMGDASDNIPGLPGVGEKTAKKLIADYGTMENMLEHGDEIKGSLGEKIRKNKELGLLSKKLATIVTDVPIQFDETKCHNDPPRLDEVKKLFEELEFRRLWEQVARDFIYPSMNNTGASLREQNEKKTQQPSLFEDENQNMSLGLFDDNLDSIETRPHDYKLIDSRELVEQIVAVLLKQAEFAFDSETTSLRTSDAEIVGLSFSWSAAQGVFVPIKSKEELLPFKPVFERKDGLKIGQNMKYDIQILQKYGIDVKGELFDTMIAHYLINPESRHNLDTLAGQYLNYRTISYDELIEKKGSKKLDIRDVEIEKLKDYASEDADICLELKHILAPMLAQKGVEKLFKELEMPLVPVLADMELTGVKIDTKALTDLSKDVTAEAQNTEREIFKQAGLEFNLNSPKQLGDVLFGRMRLMDKPKKTKTGQWATGEDVLSMLEGEHKIVADILKYRSLQKLKSTYIDALPEYISPITGRVHTSFNQTITATGRLSSNEPNLQNIPIRTQLGQEVRRAFVASGSGHKILSVDYSQIELRIIAALADEKNMIEAFTEGLDIHASTASKVFGVPINEVTRDQRAQAKTINFGILYGVSAFGLSRQSTLSIAESAKMISAYYAAYPKLLEFIEKQKEFARKNGYVETIMGRRRYLPDINSHNANIRSGAERNAVNAPIQGSAADVIKRAMIDIHSEFKAKKMAAKMLLQVHDELVFDIPVNELKDVEAMVKEKMQDAWRSAVLLKADAGVGDNWLEAH